MNKLIITLHLFIFFALLSHPQRWHSQLKPKIALHVKNSRPPAPISSVKKTTTSSLPHKPTQKKTPKKPDPKKKPKPTVAKETKTQTPLNPKTKEKETIAKIEEKIDKLDQITKEEIKHTPTGVSGETIVASDHFFASHICGYLFEILQLPGPGKVTLEIFLDGTGVIDKVAIIDSENLDNSEYLIRTLTGLRLPFEQKESIPPSLKVCFSHLAT